jgi:UPF0755 protein
MVAVCALLFIILTIGCSMLYVLNLPPTNFPIPGNFVVEKGMTVREIGEALKREHFIRSSYFFNLVTKSSYNTLSIQAGAYLFESPMTTLALMGNLGKGALQNPERVLTFPEGFSVKDLTLYTKGVFGPIDPQQYIAFEGYLFPETYFLSEHETLDDLMLRMRDEYELRIEPYRERILASGYTEAEVIILASILEREANDEDSMRTVAGILENRLKNDVPLQIDAPFEYLLGKESSELTVEDLNLDTPYNTYTHVGLLPHPIANPGIMAIEAVLNPLASSYYYYLTDANGTFHYAKTFDEHKANKERYLK